jgi:hypothetical protein
MSTRVQKQIFLPTKGNTAVVAKDTVLFDAANKWYNITPGKIGFYDASTNLAVDSTNVAAAKTIFIAIGVGTVTGHATKSKSVRVSNGEYISSCLTDYATVEIPQAGASNSASFYFSCIDCNTNYAIGIQLRDPSLNFFMPENRYQVETISVQSEACPACEGDCDYTPDPIALETAFVDAIEANEFLAPYITSVTAEGPTTVDGVDYLAGFTIVFKPNTQDCGCFPVAETILNRYTIGSIQTVIESAWAPNSTTTTIDMSGMQMAKGLGSNLQWEEFNEMPGGTGFDGLNSEVETTGAPYYAQLSVSRTKNLLVDCDTSYCQYTLGHHSSSSNEDANGHNWQPKFITNILIPVGDTTTQTSVEAVLNAFVTSGPCGKAVTLDCTP